MELQRIAESILPALRDIPGLENLEPSAGDLRVMFPRERFTSAEELEAIRENNRTLTIVFLMAAFLAFVVLAVQYESLINPFVPGANAD